MGIEVNCNNIICFKGTVLSIIHHINIEVNKIYPYKDVIICTFWWS